MFFSVLKRVFRHLRYVLGATGVAIAVLSAALLLPNLNAIRQVFSADSIGLIGKVSFLISLYGSLVTNFTLGSALYLVLIAVLFGVNIGLLTFYIRRRQEAARNTTAHLASVGGIISAALGIGCAACGSVVLTALLSLFGASGLLLLLPLHGAEFGIIGLILLCVSIVYLAKRINDPLVCPLKLRSSSVE